MVPVAVAVLAVGGWGLIDRPAPPVAPSASGGSTGSTGSAGSTTAPSSPSPSASAGTASATPSSTSATPAPTAEPEPAALDGDGVYDVGADIKPGLYRSTGSGTWERLKDTSGDLESVIASGTAAGVEYVQVAKSDGFFATRGMGDWVLVDPKAKGPQATTFEGNGTYLVGVDIAPGTYTSSGGGLWKRLKSASGDYGDIIANDSATGKTTVKIEKTDTFFATSGMGTWTRVP